MEKESFKNKELIFCSFAPVGLDDYESYFKENFSDFIYLKWKFPHGDKNTSSFLRHYREQEKIIDKKILSPIVFRNRLLYFIFLPFNYMLYFCQALFYLSRKKERKKRIFFGINYICTFYGIFLKKIGYIDFIIYRVMDFFPLPKKGIYRFLTRIFYIMDAFCLKNADSIWFTTNRHIIGRQKYGYFKDYAKKSQLIPLGINIDNCQLKLIKKNSTPTLVYCGIISKYQLLDLLFESVKELKNEFPNLKLEVIGSGPDEIYFKKIAKEMGIDKNIFFHGFIENMDEVKKIISRSHLGIALYKDEENYMKYTEPAKVKYYLNFGVPVVISKVPEIAHELDEKKISFSVNNNKIELVQVIRNYLLNQNQQKIYQENIKNFLPTIDINKLLSKNFKQTFTSEYIYD
ncbi:MAG: glycosyltransferase [Patescibacteria group bacterium]|jgi:glycosyltransferase involved in cell wall biosynthesis